jgi:hypothetical protein
MRASANEMAGRYHASALLAVAAALSAGGALASCGDDGLGPPHQGSGAASSGEGGSLVVEDAGGPPSPDAGGLCGNQIHQVIANAPNIYFVLDASGSMATAVSGSTTRYDRVHSAAVELVRNLGPLINVGAAVFPKDVSGSDTCHTGGEVFAVTPGDPYVEGQGNGPTTQGFRAATDVNPFGGTPISATLDALAPKLAELSGATIVLLATDGGPNCNPDATCPPEECIPFIEGAAGCDEACCEPNGPAGPEGCVDRDATVAAVAAVAALGINVHVIGIPGSEIYGDVLDEMALAGNAPQFVSPYYYKVDDLDTLGGVLATIASVVVSCEFDIVDPPAEEGTTNVYLDEELIPYSAIEGWSWKTPAVVELRGEPCQRVKSGQVRQVQIVSGCPTEVAN